MYPSTCLFLLRHPDRTTVYQEIKETMKLVSSINDPSNGHSFENRTAGRLWSSHLQWQGFKDTWPMVETRMFLRRVHGCADVDEALGAIFDKLMERGLHRDQNVITVVAPPYLPNSLQRDSQYSPAAPRAPKRGAFQNRGRQGKLFLDIF